MLGLIFPVTQGVFLLYVLLLLQHLKKMEGYILEELNVRKVTYSSELTSFVTPSLEVNNKVLGQELGARRKVFVETLNKLSMNQIMQLQEEGKMSIKYADGKEDLEKEVEVGNHVDVLYQFSGNSEQYEAASGSGLVVMVNKILDTSCRREGLAREMVSRVQQLRKESKLTIEDEVELFVDIPEASKELCATYQEMHDYIAQKLRQPLKPVPGNLASMKVVIDSVKPVLEESLRLVIVSKSQ